MTDRMAPQGLATARQLVVSLRALRADDVPPTLASAVLTRLALADSYLALSTPVGPVFVAYNATGISAVEWTADAAQFERSFRQRAGRPALPAPNAPSAFAHRLDACLRGERRAKEALRFDLRGLTPFEQAVLLKALDIPRGEVRPYAWIAREIGHPGAVRAVGTALGHNPIPLFIPCHRVVRSDGRLGEYSMGGSDNKRTLLAAEGAAPETLELLARSGVRYVASDSTHIYCFPTCAHGRRVMPAHRATFRSAREAAAAGYRPCKVCRPAAQVAS